MAQGEVLVTAIFVFFIVCGNVASQTCTVAQTCVTDYSEADCSAGYSLQQNAHIFNCCPKCELVNDNLPVIETGCAPPSNCLADGKYAPVQCKGDLFIGRCFCSDEDGNRIFGQMWRDEASEMTCACSRRRAELEASGRKDVTLHCQSNGDYEPLQCDSGLCWCTQPKTGQPTTPPVMAQDMDKLPCYSASSVGETYLRRCESVVHAVGTIRQEQTAHGTNYLGIANDFCDYDGSYGAYQITNGIAYCTDRAGEILGSWQAVSSEMAGMNCNCARDSILYYPERGITMTEVCQANGNYRPNQNVGDHYYCVDSDGYPTTEMLDQWPANNCVVG